MSSTSRPQATAKSQGQSPAKPSQVESTNQLPNVQFNNQFNPNIPVINPAQQLQFQSQIQQTAAFLQRQMQQQQQQQHQQQQQQQQQQPQQQQQQSTESQLKNQPLGNGPLANFHSFPDFINLFLLSNPSLNIPLSQLNPTQSPVQQTPLQTPKTVSPSKSGQSQHTSPRSATTGSRSIATNITSAQTAQTGELNNTTVTPVTAPSSAKVSEPITDIPKQLASVSPVKTTASVTTVSTPSSTISERLLEEVKERTSAQQAPVKKSSHDDATAPSSNATPPTEIGTSPETTKSPVPRRKQTNVTSPIKANPTVSPSNKAVQPDSVALSTPKKQPEDVKSSSQSPSTSATVPPVSVPMTPTTTTTTTTPPNKKVEPTKKEVQKTPKKGSENEVAKAPSATDSEKPTTSTAKAAPASGNVPAPAIPNDVEVKSKRNRIKTNLYQSPTPELVLATRMSVSEANKNSSTSKDKLIIFFADEFLAVRNDEGTFFLCQCDHNMYRTSKKCLVRWLNEEENSDGVYKLTFYDNIDKECILTSVSMDAVGGNRYKLTGNERERIVNILKKSIDVEKGLLPRPEVTEENPDGLDISLYNDESQIKTDEQAPAGHKRKSEGSSKLASPTKKAKQPTKASSDPSSSRRKGGNKSSSVGSTNKANKRTKQSKKKNLQRRPNAATKSKSTSPSDESKADDGKKKVAKTKAQKKSTESSTVASSTVGPERTLRKRSKN